MSSNSQAEASPKRSLGSRTGTVEGVSHLYVFEPGWRTSIKRGSHREFCHSQAPGQDFYHRLQDGEIYLHQGEEKLCLSCASRRGILCNEPRGLRNPIDISLADSAELPTFRPDDNL
ncbi:hypothetical protein [Aquisphaera insulae]|uniref:hypothetical protein n=1 Tax=Aquisphaera insulae TaxID=2712864 RepID=UPI0013EA157B|nr:hypothetical protein [Aquisphaera insulae]